MDGEADAELVAASLRGSHSAFARLVDRHQQAVRGFLRRIAPSIAEADDLAQETFLTAWQSMGAWRGEASLRSWLCAIAWRKAKGAQRSLLRRLMRDAGYAERSALEGEEAPEADDALALKRALARLPLKERGALALCLGGAFSHTDAAAIMGVPVGTVKSHVTRGREKLRAMLEGT